MRLLFYALALAGVSASAATVYNETAGDLSNDGLSPTALTFTLGSNQVIGSTGRASATVGIDRDYFSFTVLAGQSLTAITLLPGTQVDGIFSFIGLQAGNQVTVSPAAVTAQGLLGWSHYSTADIGRNILGDMAIPANESTGFSVPLGPGTYSVWIQDFSVPTVPYGFDFTVAAATAATPEPGTFLPVMMAGVAFVSFRFRRLRG